MSKVNNDDALVISNLGFGDITFDTDTGSWNITRALRDCNAGKHKFYGFDLETVFESIANVEVEEEKIAAMASLSHEEIYNLPPLLFVVEFGKVWLIDGHHRVHALHRTGRYKIVSGYVIEEENSKPYIIWFNGERVAPWYGRKR